MRFAGSVLLIFGAVSRVRAFRNVQAGPQITRAPSINGVVPRQDVGPITIDLGAITSYQQTTDVPIPTGVSMDIYPTAPNANGSVPESGLFIVLSPDLQASIESAYAANCADIQNPDCLDSINYVCNTDDPNTLSRRGPYLFGSPTSQGSAGIIFAFAVTYLMAAFGNGNGHRLPPNLQIHIPSSQLRHFSSLSTASTIVLATTSPDPSPVTITLTTTQSLPIPFPSAFSAITGASTTTPSGSPSSSGIIVVNGQDSTLTLPANLEATWNSFAGTVGTCPNVQVDSGPHSFTKRQTDGILDCLLGIAQFIADAFDVGGALQAVAQIGATITMQFPPAKFAAAGVGETFTQFAIWAGDFFPTIVPAVDDFLPQITGLTLLSWWLALADYSNIPFNLQLGSLKIPAIFSTEPWGATCPSDSSQLQCESLVCQGVNGKCTTPIMSSCECSICPADDEMDFCNRCGGEETGQCETIHPGCDCIDMATAYIFSVDTAWLEASYSIMTALDTMSGAAPPATASSSTTISQAPISSATSLGGPLLPSSNSASTITSLPSSTTQSLPLSCTLESLGASDYSYFPFTWCACGPTASRTMISTIPTSTGSAACIFSTAPFPLQVTPTAISSVSCSVEFDASGHYYPPEWCKCNFANDAIFPTQTGTQGCDYTTVPTAVVQPTYFSSVSYSAQSTAFPVTPTEYCSCDISGAPLYATMSGPSSNACAYSTIPSNTVTLPPTPTQGPITCNPPYDSTQDGNCWNAINPSYVTTGASPPYMNVQLPDGTVDSSVYNMTQVYKPVSGVTYMFNIGWVPGCTIYESQYPDNPAGTSGDNTVSYSTLIIDTYNYCLSENDGLGGYLDLGCLRYGFFPSDINGIYTSPPQPELFWQASNICGTTIQGPVDKRDYERREIEPE